MIDEERHRLRAPSYLQRDLPKPGKERAVYRTDIAGNVPDEDEGQNLWTRSRTTAVKWNRSAAAITERVSEKANPVYLHHRDVRMHLVALGLRFAAAGPY